MKRTIISTLAISVLFLSAITEAKVYKWEDAKGQTHYSSTPPKPSEKNFGLNKDFSFSKKSVTTTNNVATTQDKPQKTSNKDSQKLEFCKNEKKNLNLLKKNSTVTWIESGKETVLSGKILKDKIQLIKKSIRTNCSANIKKDKE